MGKMSREKGKRGERECAAFLSSLGWPARRGQQFKGGGDSPDVVCARLAARGVQVEVKRVEAFALYPALEQATKDAGPECDPVVFHRRSGKPWVVVLHAEAFLRLLGECMPAEPPAEADDW